jgi:hypothetical protein
MDSAQQKLGYSALYSAAQRTIGKPKPPESMSELQLYQYTFAIEASADKYPVESTTHCSSYHTSA